MIVVNVFDGKRVVVFTDGELLFSTTLETPESHIPHTPTPYADAAIAILSAFFMQWGSDDFHEEAVNLAGRFIDRFFHRNTRSTTPGIIQYVIDTQEMTAWICEQQQTELFPISADLEEEWV